MVIVADLGATKAVLAVASLSADRFVLASIRRYECHNYHCFEDILEQYLEDVTPERVSSLCLGAAGVVRDNQCRVTNLSWTIDGNDLSRRFGFGRVVILNDLVAGGYGLEALPQEGTEIINSGELTATGNRVLISPGTGLGETIISLIDGRYHPIASEGGHVDFAPFDGVSGRLWAYMKNLKEAVSVEDFLSGPGFHNIFNFVLGEAGCKPDERSDGEMRFHPGPAITKRALSENDPLAMRTVHIFLDICAAEAGNMALKGMATGGVFIGGGIIPHLLPILDKGRFVNCFSNKGKHRAMLEKIPIKVVTDINLPLYGAAYYVLSALSGPARASADKMNK